ncbi:hypothetical protein [Melaminivora alkalimesophila]|uniref:Uncharacterized protein n=1 Tax=Melaminivora alkalimesophila TaxID=1165852 RepID=A0A317RDS7_9BURK|nr:hypothetical protein [Melaminivora alkalimesophila]PWW47739.1 hypothetical protein DFR36_102112 [Melaminivora alkalimesophila]
MSKLQSRLTRLEAAQDARRRWPLAWPSIEAAAAAGVRGGFLLLGEVLPADEWALLAAHYMRQLTEGHHHAIEL